MVSASSIKAASAVMTSVIAVTAAVQQVERFRSAVRANVKCGRASWHSF